MKRTFILGLILLMAFSVCLACSNGQKTDSKIEIKIVSGTETIWESGKVEAESALYVPVNEKKGYTAKYFSDAALTIAITLPTVAPKKNTTIYLKYIVNTYTVNFDCGDADDIAAKKVSYDEEFNLPDSGDLEITSGTFIGWTKTQNSSNVDFTGGQKVKNLLSEDNAEITLYAIIEIVDSQNFLVRNDIVTGYVGTARSIMLPSTATKVESNAFAGNDTIFRVIVPQTYTEIGQGAFMNCPYLTQLHIPFIGGSREENRFLAYIFGADEYEENSYEKSYKYDSSAGISTNKLDQTSQYIPTALRTVVLTGETTEIPEGAFYMHFALERLVFEDSSSLVTISKNAFRGAQAFGSDQLLGAAFDLYWLETVETFEASCFAAYEAPVYKRNEDTYKYTEYYGTLPLTSLINIAKLEAAVTIEENAFAGQNIFDKLEFGENLVMIGDSAFYNSSSIALLDIPDSIESIGYMAFAYSGLTRVTIGSGIKSIDKYAFVSETLVEVMFNGSTIPDIAPNAFGNALVAKNDSYDIEYYEGQLGLFIQASKVSELSDELGLTYKGLVGAIDQSKAGKVYFYVRAEAYGATPGIRARLTTTAGHAMIVEDPDGYFAAGFLAIEYQYYACFAYNTTYAISLTKKDTVIYNTDPFLDVTGGTNIKSAYAKKDKYSPAGKDYYRVHAGDSFYNYDISLDMALYTDPATGELCLIPAFLDRTYAYSFQYGRVASEGSYLMDVDKFGNIVGLYQYSTTGTTDSDGYEIFNIVPVKSPEGTAFTKLVFDKQGVSSSSSEVRVLYFNSNNKIIKENAYLIDPKPSRWTVADFQMIAKPEDESGSGISMAFSGVASGFMEIDISQTMAVTVNIYGPGALTVFTAAYSFAEGQNADSYGDEYLRLELSNFYDALQLIAYEDGAVGTLTFSEFYDGKYHVAELVTNACALVPDMNSRDEYRVSNVSYISFAGDREDVKEYVSFDGSQTIQWLDIGDTAYIHIFDNDDGMMKIAASGIALKNANAYEYSEKYNYTTTLLDELYEFVSYFSKGTYSNSCSCATGLRADCICGGTCKDKYPANNCGCGANVLIGYRYSVVYEDGTRNLSVTVEEGTKCIFFGDVDFHRDCEAGIYQNLSDSNVTFLLNGKGHAVYTNEKGEEIEGACIRVENAVFVSSSSFVGGYMAGSINQYAFTPDGEDEVFCYFTISESIEYGKQFAMLLAKDREISYVYDDLGYIVAELRMTVMGDYSYFKYTYTLDGEGIATYSDPIATDYCAARIAGYTQDGTAIPFYYIVVDSNCKLQYYLDIVDAENNICIIDDTLRIPNAPSPGDTSNILPKDNQKTVVTYL